ncbi:hypothetical protein B566_EDAN004607 [Ephemera danica]|nr:hypothetical protein B566_EDAN004607 [Ephemera danica]
MGNGPAGYKACMVVQWSQSSHSDHTGAAAVSSNTHISPLIHRHPWCPTAPNGLQKCGEHVYGGRQGCREQGSHVYLSSWVALLSHQLNSLANLTLLDPIGGSDLEFITNLVTYHFLLQHPPAFTTLIKMLFPVLMACSGLLLVLHSQESEASPLGVCIRNCAQCKKMFGDYFEGQLCADWCVKYKGKVVPDCEDVDTIAQFLNKLE